MSLDPHVLAEARSLAFHRAVAQRIAEDPSVLERARERVAGWRGGGATHPEYVRAWAEVLVLPAEEVARRIVEDDERTRALRQCTPFAGALDPRARWQLWEDVRRRLEAV